MNSGINLLGNKKQVVVSPAVKKLRLIRGIAIGLLSFVAFTSMVLFLLIAFSPLPALQKQEQNALTTMAQYHPEVAKLKFVDDRLETATEIINNRNNYDQALAAVKSSMPLDLSITEVSMEEKLVTVTVTGISLQSLNEFLEKLLSAVEKKQDFSKVTVVSLSDSGTNFFSLTVDLVIL